LGEMLDQIISGFPPPADLTTTWSSGENGQISL
jgi:hypothetical protein